MKPARKFLPFHSGRIVIIPGRKPFTFKVEFDPQALTARGILASISNCFAKYDTPILSLHVAGKPDEPLWAFIACDLQDPRRAEGILACVKAVPYVRNAEYSPPITEGVAVDVWGYPPLLGGVRAVMLREPVFRAFLQYGWRQMGTGFGSILYHTFFDAGAEAYREFYSVFAKRREDQAKLAEHVFRLAGYGILEVVEYTDRRFVARVYDSIECKHLGEFEEAESMMIRGLLAGSVAASWGVDRGISSHGRLSA
ncbi:hypothetical protein IG193_02275 [Infirmifilum lucidum]|uniref:Uncharacterized protein n=1 Tax=Infirmifilum lucidum TaxID=2776706 RepID=A0A7L9FIZ1_9CREN|nr:hypothetical protein [Infirmifilum lucidum]QOJ79312.1 hypothetical protein IG193_02275 [Infirmifilum lucidum]